MIRLSASIESQESSQACTEPSADLEAPGLRGRSTGTTDPTHDQVLAGLEDLGSVTRENNGKYTVTLGPETEVQEAPRGKDIDEQLAVDVRRILKQAGYAPDGATPTRDLHQRDHGDGQWGEPS
jgi:hypothetical protein